VLKHNGRLIIQSQFTHSYPFCWRYWNLASIADFRSDTPLLYRIVPAWFVRVADHVDKMLAAVAETKWFVPRFNSADPQGTYFRTGEAVCKLDRQCTGLEYLQKQILGHSTPAVGQR